MITGLHGVFEQVSYRNDFSFILHMNQTNENYPLHWHPAIEIIMPIENSYEVISHGTTFSLNEGDIIFLPPGELHELKSPPTGSRIILLVDYTMISNLKGMSSVLSILRQPLCITAQDNYQIQKKINKLLLEIRDEYVAAAPLWETAVYALLIQLFLFTGRMYLNTNPMFPDTKQSKQREYIEKFDLIFDYIRTNYMKELTLDSVAKIAGFSKYHFTRLFKQYTGMSFYDYLTKERIQIAETLLLNPQLSVTDVAFQSGFTSISTFNRVFRTMKKCSPREFRSLYKQK